MKYTAKGINTSNMQLVTITIIRHIATFTMRLVRWCTASEKRGLYAF